MAKNKIEDLRNHLFAQLERLDQEDLKPEDIDREVQRAIAMASVGNVIVNSAKAEMQYVRLTQRKGTGFIPELDNGEVKKIEGKERNIKNFIEG